MQRSRVIMQFGGLTEEEKFLQQKYKLLRGIKSQVNRSRNAPDGEGGNKVDFDSKLKGTGGTTPNYATELAKKLVRSGKVVIPRHEQKGNFKKANVFPRKQADDNQSLNFESFSPGKKDQLNGVPPVVGTGTGLDTFPISPTSVVFRKPMPPVKRPSSSSRSSGDYYDFKRRPRPIISYADCEEIDTDDDEDEDK